MAREENECVVAVYTYDERDRRVHGIKVFAGFRLYSTTDSLSLQHEVDDSCFVYHRL